MEKRGENIFLPRHIYCTLEMCADSCAAFVYVLYFLALMKSKVEGMCVCVRERGKVTHNHLM